MRVSDEKVRDYLETWVDSDDQERMIGIRAMRDLLDARARVKELTNLIENAYQNHGCTSGETYTPGCDFCSLRRALRRGEEAGE